MNPATWLQCTAKPVPQAPALMCGESLEANNAEFARRAAAIAPALRSSHSVCLCFRVGTNRSG